jgi:ankyrin repeat protein
MLKFLTFVSRTPLHVAVHHDNDDVFHLLLSKGAKLEVKTSEGFPPLWYALKQESRDLTQFGFAANLIAKGASPNTVKILPYIVLKRF